MPAERFAPMPTPDPEEIPGDKKQLNSILVNEFVEPGTKEPEETTDVHRVKTKIFEKPVERAGPPPIPEAARKKGPPPIPEAARRKGPPPIPEAAKRKGPPPIPEAARKKRPSTPEGGQRVSIESISKLGETELRTVESKEGESRLLMGAASESSPDHPERNEDAFFQSPSRGLQAVFDGMGGVPAGDLASNAAAKELMREKLDKGSPLVKKVFESDRDDVLNQEDVEEAMKEIIRRMDETVSQIGKSPELQETILGHFRKEFNREPKSNDPRDQYILDVIRGSIGCTASISKLYKTPDNKHKITIGQVGDSSTYRLRGGNLEKLSKDDSLIQALTDAEMKDVYGNPIPNTEAAENAFIAKADLAKFIRSYNEEHGNALAPYEKRLTKAAKEMLVGNKKVEVINLGSMRHVVTQAVGVSEYMGKEYKMEFKPGVATYDVEDGDMIITLGDGITDNLGHDEILAVLLLEKDPKKAVTELQRLATLRSIKGEHPRAKKDDATAVAMKVSLGK